MKQRLIFLSFVLVSLFVFAVLISPPDGSFAASNGAGPLPTPKTKAVRTKTVRELTFTGGEFDGNKIVRTDEEWKKLLTANEFYVLRQEGTEAPYTGSLLKNKKRGTYHCAACGLALFTSSAKYESDTGWPSFFQPIFPKNVVEKLDKSLAEERTEVVCPRCDSHIGHVFDDGPKPTGLRYCMNSAALKFRAGR